MTRFARRVVLGKEYTVEFGGDIAYYYSSDRRGLPDTLIMFEIASGAEYSRQSLDSLLPADWAYSGSLEKTLVITTQVSNVVVIEEDETT